MWSWNVCRSWNSCGPWSGSGPWNLCGSWLQPRHKARKNQPALATGLAPPTRTGRRLSGIIFVGRGFSHDIKPTRASRLQPLKFRFSSHTNSGAIQTTLAPARSPVTASSCTNGCAPVPEPALPWSCSSDFLPACARQIRARTPTALHASSHTASAGSSTRRETAPAANDAARSAATGK